MDSTMIEEEVLAREKLRERLAAKAKKKMIELRKIHDAAFPILRDLAAYEQLIDRSVIRRRDNVRIDWVKVRYVGSGTVNVVPYKAAVNLVKAKRAVIIEEEKQVPRYERTFITEPDPEILDDIRRLDLGRLITVEGKVSSVFKKFVERIGSDSFDLNTAAAFQTLSPEEIERYLEDDHEKE